MGVCSRGHTYQSTLLESISIILLKAIKMSGCSFVPVMPLLGIYLKVAHHVRKKNLVGGFFFFAPPHRMALEYYAAIESVSQGGLGVRSPEFEFSLPQVCD